MHMCHDVDIFARASKTHCMAPACMCHTVNYVVYRSDEFEVFKFTARARCSSNYWNDIMGMHARRRTRVTRKVAKLVHMNLQPHCVVLEHIASH